MPRHIVPPPCRLPQSPMPPETISALEQSPLYSETLGIDLFSEKEGEYFRWLIAALLFGGRISETIAVHTFQSFMRHNLRTPRQILDAGWDFLVKPVMREGGYVRYDESKSRQILGNCQMLIDDYDGKPGRISAAATGPQDLEARLCAFHGVGPVTANIFLRELRPVWPMADPEPLPAVRRAAAAFGVDLGRYDRKSVTFARVEAGLLRHRRELAPPKD